MISWMHFGKDMELYALIALALIVVVFVHKKIKSKPSPMEIDTAELLKCEPMLPPSPMSVSSDDFVIDSTYIK